MRPSIFRSPGHHPARRRPDGRNSRASIRAGRLLVECCVSMVLLAGAGALVLLVTANTAHLVDESRQRDRVLRAMSVRLAGVRAIPCGVSAEFSHEPAGPRALLHIAGSSQRAVHTLAVEAWWQASGLAGSVWHRHATSASGWCE